MTIDEAIKGKNIDPNKLIFTTDYVDFNNAYYVSKRGNVEDVLSRDAIDRGSNDKAFSTIARKAKSEFSGKPVVVGAIDVTHYNFVNRNLSFYMLDYITPNSKTWIVKADAGSWGKPIQQDHNPDQDQTLGRVVAATPFIYPNANENNLTRPDGHIEIIYYVTSTEAIERMMDGRYKTMSVSASAKPQDILCSICGKAISDYDCEHWRGKMYPVSEKSSKKQLCFWKWTYKRYTEASFVTKPADDGAVNKKMSLINIPGVDAQDSIVYNYNKESFGEDSDENVRVIPQIMMMVGKMDHNQISNLQDASGNDIRKSELFMSDSVVDETVNIGESDDDVQTEPAMGSDEGTTCSGTDDETGNNKAKSEGSTGNESSKDDETSDNIVAIGLLADMLENDLVSLEDAIVLAYEHGVHVPRTDSSDLQKTLDYFNDYLEGKDAKLTAAKRKRLSASTFCGPNRSYPVPDCQHVATARAYLNNPRAGGKLSPSVRARIRACVNRKAKAMGCSNPSGKQKDNTNQEAMNKMKYQFDSENDLIQSAPVQKHVDEIVSKHEQEMDDIKSQYKERADSFKAIAVNAIIDMSLKLSKPLTSSIASAKDDEQEKIKKDVTDKLSLRTVESLADNMSDLSDEISVKSESSDKDQAAVDAALKNKGPGQENAQANDSEKPEDKKGQPASDSSPAEENNQAGAEAQDKNQKDEFLSSFTKKRI